MSVVPTGTNKAHKFVHKFDDISVSNKAVHDKPEKKVNIHSLI